MPSSPALTGAGSPSLGPTSVPLSQQQAEHAKAARKPVIHLLAASPLTEQAIHDKVPEVSKNDLTQALQKVGDFTESTGMWELRRSFYKELDVYSFKYDSAEDRQQAIDNAVKAYDKMRLSPSDPEWDRLLIKAERGTGKCLSKLQAQIAQNSAKGPKINVENADSGRDTPSGKDDDLVSDKNLSKVKGEGTARSSPQGPATKTKKVSEKEAQAKRLLSKNPSKAAAKSAPKTTPKATPRAPPAKKQAPAKAKATTNAKVLSSEFVNESDDDDDHPPPPPPKPLAKVAKRSREEEEVETSDSSVPLSKKPRKEISVPNHRVSDASQTSRNTNYSSHYSSNSSKTKNNSPQKSSPLASSPPTNASEFDNSSADGRTSSSASPAHPSAKNTRSPIHKRHQKSSSVTSSSSSGSTRYLKPEVTDLARRFKMYYPKYEALHKEIELMISGGRRDQKKEQDLFDMHARLEGMKKQIFAGIVEY
jgi:RNA polymerase II elongation factor ELL